MSLRFLLLFAVVVMNLCCAQTRECHSQYNCSGQAIETFSRIECYGYHSCSNAIEISNTGQNLIQCHGSFSCYNAALIRHVAQNNVCSVSNILCYGLYSCASSKNIYNECGNLYCSGASSCRDTNVVVEGDILSWAFRAVSASDVTASDVFNFYGSYDAQDSILRSGDDAVSIEFHGHESGLNAQIICSGTCSITCHAGGCNKLSTSCSSGTSCFNINCESAMQSTVCPKGYILPESYELPSLETREFSTFEAVNYTCDNSSINCDAYQDEQCFRQQTHGIDKQNGAVCCSGYESCKLTLSISANVDGSQPGVTAFRADGYYSSEEVPDTIHAINGGDLYFTGAYANFDTGSRYKTLIDADGMGDVVVSGRSAMQYKIVDNVKDLFCLAHYACRGVIAGHVGGNIYAYGKESLEYSLVYNVAGSVFCSGNEACVDIDVIGVGVDVIGVGNKILYKSTISNVTGAVVAYGNEASYQAAISHAGDVHVNGYRALYESIILDVANIVANGFQCLSKSQILGLTGLDVNGTSALDESQIITDSPDNTFTAFISGTNTGSYSIFCSASDTCRIQCRSRYACTSLQLHCEGTCYVECDESDDTNRIECPAAATGNDWVSWTTSAPSSVPSTSPSDTPSRVPSILPSNMPSVEPTTHPSDVPTVVPTMQPTLFPTGFPTNLPTNLPSLLPSTEPSVQPSETPSAVPTTLPTNIPSDPPSLQPTLQPSLAPTLLPSASPVSATVALGLNQTATTSFDDIDGTHMNINPNDMSTSASESAGGAGTAHDRESSEMSESAIVAVVVVSGVACVLLASLSFVLIYCNARQRAKDQINKEIEMKRIQMARYAVDPNDAAIGAGAMATGSSCNNINNTSGARGGTAAGMASNCDPPALVRTATGTVSRGGESVSDILDAFGTPRHAAVGGMDEIEMDAAIDAMCGGDDGKLKLGSRMGSLLNVIDDVDHECEGREDSSDDCKNESLGSSVHTNGTTSTRKATHRRKRAVGDTKNAGTRSTRGTSKGTAGLERRGEDESAESDDLEIMYEKGSDAADTIRSTSTVDAKNFANWTEKKVLSWLETVLEENGFDGERIKMFLKEFREKSIDGQRLIELEEQGMDQFKQGFSKDNQVAGIWIVLMHCVAELSE